MDAFSVVVLKPGRKGVSSGLVGGEDLPVGPFGGEGAVEAFDFAVGPGAVRFDEPLLSSDRGDRVLEIGRVPISERVVGEDSFDPRDALAGEELGRAQQNAGRGGSFLVIVDLGIGQAAVVVDDGVDVVEADRCLVEPGSVVGGGFASGSPSAAVRDLA